MRKLIINADDFGYHEEINKGIIRAFQEGCLTSTTLMCSASAFENAVALAKENPDLGVGIHLTLVSDVKPVLPLEKVPSLVDEQGLFYSDYVQFIKNFYLGKISKEEIKLELTAQIMRAIEAGINITHVDSHQHLHVLPGLTDIVIELCRSFDIKAVRLPCEDYFKTYGYAAPWGRVIGRDGLSFCAKLAARKFTAAGLVYPRYFFGMLSGGNLNVHVVAEFLDGWEEGTAEIMTHPGSSMEILRARFPWPYHWEQERDIFLNNRICDKIKERQITLINFGGLLHE